MLQGHTFFSRPGHNRKPLFQCLLHFDEGGIILSTMIERHYAALWPGLGLPVRIKVESGPGSGTKVMWQVYGNRRSCDRKKEKELICPPYREAHCWGVGLESSAQIYRRESCHKAQGCTRKLSGASALGRARTSPSSERPASSLASATRR